MAQLQALIDHSDHEFNTRRTHQALPKDTTPHEAWLATSRTPPPITPSPETLPSESALLGQIADTAGTISLAGARYQTGIEHARTLVHCIFTEDTVEMFASNGTHIRTTTRAARGAYDRSGLSRARRPSRLESPNTDETEQSYMS